MIEENVQGKPTPPPLRDVREGVVPKRRGRPPKVRLPEGVVKADDATITGPGMTVTIDGTKIAEQVRKQVELAREQITPLLTLHLRRAKNEITDATGTVHIPASGAIPDGTKLVAHFYQDE